MPSSTSFISALLQRLERVPSRSRHALLRDIRKLQQTPDERLRQQLCQRLEQAGQQCAARAASVPVLSLPAELPVSQRADDIRAALLAHQVIIVAGDTGSGKTTQLPKICLAAGRGVCGLIGHTQPRRIAARSVAARIAEELASPLGAICGYEVRFEKKTAPGNLLKVMTDGILLAEIQNDRYLSAYDTLIIDEAHERSLNIDLLLGYLKQLLPRRPDLKLVITSATIDVQRFAAHFSGAPVLQVEGRTYPVDVWYRPVQRDDAEDDRPDEQEEGQAILAAIDELLQHERSSGRRDRRDMLVFLPTEADIRELSQLLRRHGPQDIDVLPLYARLPVEKQKAIFEPGGQRRIVLCTNVAETSLTVPNIGYVIDSGYARISRYSYRSKVQRLPIEAISQASANQRKGRCGRVAPGICVRLYDEQDFLSRPAFTEPEIQRTNLAAVILTMLSARLGDIDQFPFMEPPDSRYVNDGFRVLEELGAIDDQRCLTGTGRQLAHFPLDPRLARQLVAGAEQGALNEVLVIVSALAAQDPRERPPEAQQAADERHRAFADEQLSNEQSDFLFYLKLWQAWQLVREDKSRAAQKQWCRKQFLAWTRMREWTELHRQLLTLCQQANLRFNAEPAEPVAIHKSLLTGLVTQVAQIEEETRSYLAPRGQHWQLFPGSFLYKKRPRWLMAAEVVETRQVYARCVAKVEPEWIELAAAHLVKRHYSDPHWEKKRGEVTATEQVSLYGLVLSNQRRVGYGRIDAVASRSIFLREGLVPGDFQTRGKFLAHNQQLREELEEHEHRLRTRGILVDDEAIAAFYEARIPADICDQRSFERWRESAEKTQPTLLRMTEADLLQQGSDAASDEEFPATLAVAGMQLPLSYHFSPGDDDDGVTVSLPEVMLSALPDEAFDWLVPGLLLQRVEALLRGLPKAQRRQVVPVPDYARAALSRMDRQQPLYPALARALSGITGARFAADDFVDAELPAHLQIRLQILAADGRVLHTVRGLRALRKPLSLPAAPEARPHPVPQPVSLTPGQALLAWDFGDLPDSQMLQQAGMAVPMVPTLQRQAGDSVHRVLAADKTQAERHLYPAQLALLMQECRQETAAVERSLAAERKLWPGLRLWGEDVAALIRAVRWQVFRVTFPRPERLPRTGQDWQHWRDQGRGQLVPAVQTALAWARTLAEAEQQLVRLQTGLPSVITGDIQAWRQRMQSGGGLADLPWVWAQRLPRYLQAHALRAERWQAGGAGRDAQQRAVIAPCWQQLQQLLRDMPEQLADESSPACQFRWMVEEFYVSQFAQPMKTAMPVSAARLNKQWQQLR